MDNSVDPLCVQRLENILVDNVDVADGVMAVGDPLNVAVCLTWGDLRALYLLT